MIKYDISHQYQPTNHTCSQTALSMLLNHYGHPISTEKIAEAIPVIKNEQGAEWGTINPQLATWCLTLGFKVEMHTADFQIIDLAWKDLPASKVLDRLTKAKDHRAVPSLGAELSSVYVQAYIDFISSGGKLHIHPYMTSELLNQLLQNGPILPCLSYNVLYCTGRDRDTGLRQSVLDDINGKVTNHSVVIYGLTDNQNYLIADPWREPGFHEIEPQRLLAAMTAAQIECDNVIFQLING